MTKPTAHVTATVIEGRTFWLRDDVAKIIRRAADELEGLPAEKVMKKLRAMVRTIEDLPK